MQHFSYESFNETLTGALKKLEVAFFNAVVDAATSTIQERFSSLKIVGEVWSADTIPKSHI